MNLSIHTELKVDGIFTPGSWGSNFDVHPVLGARQGGSMDVCTS